MQNFSKKYFSDKIPGFSDIIEFYANLGIGFCITELVLSNHKKNQSVKANFTLTMRATLMQITNEIQLFRLMQFTKRTQQLI